MQQPKETFIVFNGSAGAFVDVPCSIWARYMELEEVADQATGVVAIQGLRYQVDDDNYALTRFNVPGEKLSKGDLSAAGSGCGRMIGGPANNSGGGSRPANIPFKVKSSTVNGGTIRVREWS